MNEKDKFDMDQFGAGGCDSAPAQEQGQPATDGKKTRPMTAQEVLARQHAGEIERAVFGGPKAAPGDKPAREVRADWESAEYRRLLNKKTGAIPTAPTKAPPPAAAPVHYCRNCSEPLKQSTSDDCWRCYNCGTVVPAMDVAQGNDPAQPREEVRVHIFDQGRPLCGFTTARPVDWPKGHERVPLDVQNAKETCNCIDCIKQWRPEQFK